MDRRKALKNLGILSGGLVLLPSCDFSEEKISLTLNKLKITESQESLMNELVSSIIPEGEILGAKGINLQNFIWVIVDDCMEASSQESYLRGLSAFNNRVEAMTGKSFNNHDQEERVKTLKSIVKGKEDGADAEEIDLIHFVETTKQIAIWGYMTSKYMMTDIMPYRLVPSTYGPCETIDNTQRINMNA